MNEEHIIIMYLSLCKAFALLCSAYMPFIDNNQYFLYKKYQGSPKISTFWLRKQETT